MLNGLGGLVSIVSYSRPNRGLLRDGETDCETDGSSATLIIMSGNTWYEEIGGCPWYHHWYPLQLLRNIVRDQADMQAMFDNV